MRFLHFLCLSSKILKECGCNFTWCFGKIMWIKSLKMVFVAKIIRHKLFMIYALFDFFLFKNHFWPKMYFLTAEINLTTWSPLYTCLVKPVMIVACFPLLSWFARCGKSCFCKYLTSSFGWARVCTTIK